MKSKRGDNSGPQDMVSIKQTDDEFSMVEARQPNVSKVLQERNKK